MREALKLFTDSLYNSLLPEFADRDDVKLREVFSKKTTDTLQSFLDEQLGDAEVGTVQSFNYKSLNDYFGLKNFNDLSTIEIAKEFFKNSDGMNIKMTLGEFRVTRTEDGYKVTDIYDFNPNLKSTGAKAEGGVQFKRDVFDNIRQGNFYSGLHAVGGLMLGDDSGATRTINWDIPEGEAISAKKLENKILTRLEKEGF